MNNPDKPFRQFESAQTTIVRAIEVFKFIFADAYDEIQLNSIITELSFV